MLQTLMSIKFIDDPELLAHNLHVAIEDAYGFIHYFHQDEIIDIKMDDLGNVSVLTENDKFKHYALDEDENVN